MPPKCQPIMPVHPAVALNANRNTERPSDHISSAFTRIRVIIAPKANMLTTSSTCAMVMVPVGLGSPSTLSNSGAYM